MQRSRLSDISHGSTEAPLMGSRRVPDYGPQHACLTEFMQVGAARLIQHRASSQSSGVENDDLAITHRDHFIIDQSVQLSGNHFAD